MTSCYLLGEVQDINHHITYGDNNVELFLTWKRPEILATTDYSFIKYKIQICSQNTVIGIQYSKTTEFTSETRETSIKFKELKMGKSYIAEITTVFRNLDKDQPEEKTVSFNIYTSMDNTWYLFR